VSTHGSHPVSHGVLSRVLKRLAKDQRVVNRLAWWAQYGYSCERWFQFGLAFLLDKALAPDYAVGCERNRVDIVIYDAADPKSQFSKQIPLAGVELKWYANWWFKDKGAGLLKDVEKIAKPKYPRPALALGVWLFVTPSRNSFRHRWVLEQVNKGIGVKTRRKVRATLSLSAAGPPEIEAFAKCASHKDFKSMSLWAAGYFNGAARPAQVTTGST